MPRTRVQVRLEEDQDATAVAERRDRRRDLRGMVGIVVDDLDTARLTATLESAAGAAKVRESSFRILAVDARELERSQRRGRIAAIVVAVNRELSRKGVQLLAAHARLRGRKEGVEQTLDLTLRSEGRVVVEVDVRQHGDLRFQRFERP